jgi:hypothetical protein
MEQMVEHLLFKMRQIQELVEADWKKMKAH